VGGLNRLTGRQLVAVRASLPARTTRPPLVVPARALRDDEQLAVRLGPTEVGAAPQLVEDDDGGRVYVHGNLAYAWDAGDAAGRRCAAVSLTRLKAATELQVAAAFAVNPATLRRWETRCSDTGAAGLLTQRKGPKRKSKLTPDTVAAIRRLRAGGASYRTVAATVGVSVGSVHNALRPIGTGADADSEEPCAPTGSDSLLPEEQEPELEAGTEPKVDGAAGDDCPATAFAVMAAPPVVEAPVLADPVPHAGERVSARSG
jgi:hypothetical protein